MVVFLSAPGPYLVASLVRQFHAGIDFHLRSRGGNPVVLRRRIDWSKGCRTDVLCFGDRLRRCLARRSIDRNFAANGIALVVRPDLVTVGCAATHEVRPDGQVGLLMRPELPIGLLKLPDYSQLIRSRFACSARRNPAGR